jgi:hypothetical protein
MIEDHDGHRESPGALLADVAAEARRRNLDSSS